MNSFEKITIEEIKDDLKKSRHWEITVEIPLDKISIIRNLTVRGVPGGPGQTPIKIKLGELPKDLRDNIEAILEKKCPFILKITK